MKKAAASTLERDLTDQIQVVLMQELHHRMKNMLAVVGAIVRQSLKSSENVQVAERAITARLIAMANAHDLLLNVDMKSSNLSDIIYGAIKQHTNGEERIRLQGDDLEILASAVVPLTLLVNELCTNATKYGALSSDEGFVLLSWNRESGRGPITFQWIERSGPIVSQPSAKSLGTKLIEEALPRQLGGTGIISYKSTGLEFVMVLPSESILASDEISIL